MLLWLAAILNSPLGQAWIAVTSSPRGLTNEVLESLPLPDKFDPWFYDYKVEVPASVSKITVTPTAMSNKITSMKLNGKLIEPVVLHVPATGS